MNCSLLTRALCCLAATLGPSASAHDFGRLNRVAAEFQVPGMNGFPLSHMAYGTLAMAVAHDSIYFSHVKSPSKLFVIRNGIAQPFVGTGTLGTDLVPGIRDVEAMAGLQDGSLLVARANQVWRIKTADGLHASEVLPFAGGGVSSRDYLGSDPLRARLGVVSSMLQLRDGGVLIVASDRIYLVRDGVLSVYAGTGVRGSMIDPSSATHTFLNDPSDVAEMADGSVLVADSRNARILRIAHGKTTVFADASGLNHVHKIVGMPYKLAVLTDQSVLVSQEGAHGAGNFLLRITETMTTCFSGSPEKAWQLPQDPDGWPGYHGGPFIQMATLSDQSVLVLAAQEGLMLVSPHSPYQTTLESLVREAKESSPGGGAAKRELMRLGGLLHDHEEESDLAHLDAVLKPLLPFDLIKIIHGYTKNPWEHLRARMALNALKED